MAEKKYNLSLVVRAVDRATLPLQNIAAQVPKFAKSVKGFGGAIKNVGSEVFKLGARMAAFGAVAAFGLFSLVKGAVTAGDDLATLADLVKLNVDTFASLRYAADQADVEVEQFDKGMKMFARNMGDATAGTGTLYQLLKKISPTFARQIQHAKGTEEGLSLMTDAFSKITDPAKRASLAAAAFGAKNLQMGVFLSQGSAAIQAQQRRFLELSGSQEAFARASGDLDNAMKDTKTAVMGLSSTAFGALFPALTKLTKAVTNFIVKNRDGIAKWADKAASAIQKWIDGGGFERLVTSLVKIADTIASVVRWLGPWGVALAGAAVALAPLISALVAAVPAVYALGAALLTTPVGWVVLAIGAIAASVWAVYDNWGPLSAFFKTTFGKITGVLTGFREQAMGVLTLDFDRIVAGWTKTIEGFKASLDFLGMLPNITNPVTLLGASLDRRMGGGPAALGAAGTMGAAKAAPPVSTTSELREARVSVNFANLPRGANVSVDPRSTAPLDMSIGPAMVLP